MTQIEDKDVPDLSEKRKKTFKTVLLCVHSLTLILSVVLFVCGLVTNLRHLAYHQAWHASYGIYNGSVMSIIVGLVCTIISVIGKKCLVHVIWTERRMSKLVLNVKYLLSLSFFTAVEFYNLGDIQGIIRVH